MKLRYRLLLVRHGQASSNQRGAFLGRRDDLLTDLGKEQILSLRERIKDEKPAAIWASPLMRARQTAAMLGETFDLEPKIVPNLMEQDYGQWDGIHFKEVASLFEDDFRAWMTGDVNIGPTEGETLQQVSDRVMACFGELDAEATEGESYIWVGHAGAFAALLCGLMGTPLCNQWPYMLQAGSLTEIQFLNFGPRLTRMSWS